VFPSRKRPSSPGRCTLAKPSPRRIASWPLGGPTRTRTRVPGRPAHVLYPRLRARPASARATVKRRRLCALHRRQGARATTASLIRARPTTAQRSPERFRQDMLGHDASFRFEGTNGMPMMVCLPRWQLTPPAERLCRPTHAAGKGSERLPVETTNTCQGSRHPLDGRSIRRFVGDSRALAP
jgi:hypothetical protein